MFKTNLHEWVFSLGMLVLVMVFIPKNEFPPEKQNKTPVSIRIQDANLEFPLEPRPTNIPAGQGVPYVSGPAFWQMNGYAVDISSHCTETPGMYFDRMEVGNILLVTYEDHSNREMVINEIIVIKYESQSDPLNHDFIDRNGKHYTQMEFLKYTMLRKDAYVLHSSLCSQGISFGQTFYIAN